MPLMPRMPSRIVGSTRILWGPRAWGGTWRRGGHVLGGVVEVLGGVHCMPLAACMILIVGSTHFWLPSDGNMPCGVVLGLPAGHGMWGLSRRMLLLE